MINFAKLTHEGMNLAIMAINSTSGSMMANRALFLINREQALITEWREAGMSDGDIQSKIDDLDEHNMDQHAKETQDSGQDTTPVTMEQYAALFVATNDELVSRALPTGKWPIAGTVENVIDFKCKQLTPRKPGQADVRDFRTLMEAYKGPGAGANLTDTEVMAMLDGEGKNRAEYFATQFTDHRKEIADRMHEAVALFTKSGDDTSWEVLLSNLPGATQLMFLNAIDSRLESKMRELATGRRADGSFSKGALRPMIERANDISLHRGDQAAIREEKAKFAHEEAGPESAAPRTQSPGTPVTRHGDGKAADKALEPPVDTTPARQVSQTLSKRERKEAARRAAAEKQHA